MSSPRTLNEIIEDMLGAQAMTICQLQAQLEAANAKMAALTLPDPKPVDHEG